MMTHRITPSVDYNQWLKRSNTQPKDPTNQNSVPKVVNPKNNNKLLKTFVNY